MDFHIRTELNPVVCTKVHDTSILRTIALETISTFLPELKWIYLYTDGSPVNDIEIAGAGVCSNLFFFHSHIVKDRTAFDGKVAAVRMDLTQLHLTAALAPKELDKGWKDLL